MLPTGITIAGGSASATRSAGGSSFLDDILKTGQSTAEPDEARGEDSGAYKAFHLEKRPETLELRLSDDDGEIFDYMMVRTISYRLGKLPQRITVYTSAGRIIIKGRNLRELKNGFTRRGVAYVREFDALHFAALSDEAPCITHIDFLPLDGKKPGGQKPMAIATAPSEEPG